MYTTVRQQQAIDILSGGMRPVPCRLKAHETSIVINITHALRYSKVPVGVIGWLVCRMCGVLGDENDTGHWRKRSHNCA